MVIINEEGSVKFGLYKHYKGDHYLCYDGEIDANFDDGRLRAVYNKVEISEKGGKYRIESIEEQRFSRSAEDFNATVLGGKPRFELLSICHKPIKVPDIDKIGLIGLPKMSVCIDPTLGTNEIKMVCDTQEVTTTFSFEEKNECPSCGGTDFLERCNESEYFFKCFDCEYSSEVP